MNLRITDKGRDYLRRYDSGIHLMERQSVEMMLAILEILYTKVSLARDVLEDRLIGEFKPSGDYDTRLKPMFNEAVEYLVNGRFLEVVTATEQSKITGGNLMEKFWMVYAEATKGSHYRHLTLDDAKKEAERLARLKNLKGRKIYILECVAYCSFSNKSVEWVS